MMSYVTLTKQYHDTLVEKIQNFLISEYNLESIELDKPIKCKIEEGYEEPTTKLLMVINEGLECIGVDYLSNDSTDFTIKELSIKKLSILMDALLAGEFKILQIA